MPTPQQPEPSASGVPILFIRCPACWRHPVTFGGVRLGEMVLSCERCRHEWTRADRRNAPERRQGQRTVPRERREAQRRSRVPTAAPAALTTAEHQSSTPLATQAPAAADRRSEVLGSSIIIKGDVSADQDLVLEGRVEGSISVPGHTLTVGVDAHVAAVVAAKDVIVHGSFTGEVTAAACVAITPGAHVKGNLVTPALVIVEGAEFTGRVNKTPEQEKGPVE